MFVIFVPFFRGSISQSGTTRPVSRLISSRIHWPSTFSIPRPGNVCCVCVMMNGGLWIIAHRWSPMTFIEKFILKKWWWFSIHRKHMKTFFFSAVLGSVLCQYVSMEVGMISDYHFVIWIPGFERPTKPHLFEACMGMGQHVKPSKNIRVSDTISMIFHVYIYIYPDYPRHLFS